MTERVSATVADVSFFFQTDFSKGSYNQNASYRLGHVARARFESSELAQRRLSTRDIPDWPIPLFGNNQIGVPRGFFIFFVGVSVISLAHEQPTRSASCSMLPDSRRSLRRGRPLLSPVRFSGFRFSCATTIIGMFSSLAQPPEPTGNFRDFDLAII